MYASHVLHAATLTHKAQRSPVYCLTSSRNLWLELMWYTEKTINKLKELSS